VTQKYDVVKGENVDDVVRDVNKMLEKGWCAVGGLEHNRGSFQQAIVFGEPKKPTAYQIVQADHPELFARRVNADLQCNGWDLWGSPSFVERADSSGLVTQLVTTYMQAMVKYR
jgi:hypothetical protein